MSYRLPSVAVITAFSSHFSGRCANYETEPEDAVGYVNMSATDVFDATAKIELERATTNRNYFHIRFCYTNRYWGISPDSDSGRIKAAFLEKDEDISKPTCTLFEAIPSIGDFYHLRFTHNGKHVKAIETARNFGQLVLDDDRTGTWDEMYQRFSFLGWDTLLKMPKHVAFLGNNDKFLRVFPLDDQLTLLQFSADEGNKLETAFEVIQDGRGRVQLKSAQNNRFWGAGDWVIVNSTTSGTLFWPVRLDNKTIALRTTGNRFCRRVTQGNLRDILSSTATTILGDARLVVKELIMTRQIYDVVYHMDDARIYGLRPVVAGTARAINTTQSEGQQTVTVNVTDESSYTFSNSSSLTTGVSTSITASFGSIVSVETGITMSSERTVSTEFGQEVTRSVSSEASYQVPVPPMSTVIVHYVATEGKCDIPFSYTQRDRRSSDATFVISKNDDGIYTGVNYFNFHFEQIQVIKHLPSGM